MEASGLDPVERTDRPSGPTSGGRPAAQLDDETDREELRNRYGMLLQELRVLLPGDQVLVAFMLTAPLAPGFSAVDQLGRILYGVALMCGLLSIIAFTTPIAFHRFGDRDERSRRLTWGIYAARTGITLLGVSLISAFAVVIRLVFDGIASTLLIVVAAVALVASWLVLPQITRRGIH